PNASVNITVNGGKSFGSCTIDRNSGLPISSKIERFIDMTVDLSDGHKFDQRKLIVTSIHAFPVQAGSRPVMADPVQRVSGTHQQPGGVIPAHGQSFGPQGQNAGGSNAAAGLPPTNQNRFES